MLNGLEEWNFGPPGGGPLYVADRLRACMSAEPKMKVMFAEGNHDLATPWFATRYTIEHMNLSPELRATSPNTATTAATCSTTAWSR